MPVAVLVHGGLHGGWCWIKVSRLLSEDGWSVYTPSLTGLGDRKHLIGPLVTHETHVQDIVNIIEVNDLDQVVLCGHSSGGSVVTMVADRIPDRIRHIIYLDANVPMSGQSNMDVLGEPLSSNLRTVARDHGDGWLLPARMFSAENFGVFDPVDAAWVNERLADHPLRSFEDPIVLSGATNSVPSKTYVAAEHSGFEFTDRLLRKFESTAGWTTHKWGVGHDMMITEPGMVRDLIVQSTDLGGRPGAPAT